MSVLSTQTGPSEEQKLQALLLCEKRACPECGRKLSLYELLCMVRGGGFTFYIKARMEDGCERIIREKDFDPQTMVLVEN
jgi:hypothetical protein